MSELVDEHRQYLTDAARIAAFEQAIAETVRAGDVVADLGAGTGLLGLLACRAGAARVYAIESGGMIEIARSLARANGCADRIVFVPGHSQHVELPERVDVVVADQIGRFGFEAGVLDYFADARRRWLKPGGRLVPRRIDLYVAPVEHATASGWVEGWRHPVSGLDVSPVRAWAVNTGYPVTYQPSDLLGEAAIGASVDLEADTWPALAVRADIPVTRAGLLHGIGGWFGARLSASTAMTNAPGASLRIGRQNVFLPLDAATSVGPGDRVEIAMSILPADVTVAWTATVRDASGRTTARFAHSTLGGMLTRREDLQRTRPDFVPRLSPRGEARKTVLELCDGRRALADVERVVYARHAALFRSPEEAAAFVAEVVTRYTA